MWFTIGGKEVEISAAKLFSRKSVETILGATVLSIIGISVYFAFSATDLKPDEGYKVTAQFNAVDGLVVGGDVRIGGVKIGTVVDQKVDPESFKAVVTMTIRPDVRLTKDTQVRIGNDGLLGGNYIKLEPGGGKKLIGDGAELKKTKDVISLGELLERVLVLVREGPAAKTPEF
ncbi:MAG: outer membrane lipid asymmetry maintenance protein MlaD [Rhodospirillaceae bacterium]|nr:outer membrane lipid asymmetry maintenance protein MlaD [Rhodospirillaceae bacterium]HAA91996.1 outer membrane lipid asymmetry maintenance protein MlaD [Rhodospirillaceae bacterium]